jgi:hypothetical protein
LQQNNSASQLKRERIEDLDAQSKIMQAKTYQIQSTSIEHNIEKTTQNSHLKKIKNNKAKKHKKQSNKLQAKVNDAILACYLFLKKLFFGNV